MKTSHDYVLVLDQEADNLQAIDALLRILQCPTVIASSADQVMTRSHQGIPYLMILVGNHQQWSAQLVNDLRHASDAVGGTILSLTDVYAPRWNHCEENPGFDGFLVQPLSYDVLIALMQSAWAKHLCRSCKSHSKRSRGSANSPFSFPAELNVYHADVFGSPC